MNKKIMNFILLIFSLTLFCGETVLAGDWSATYGMDETVEGTTAYDEDLSTDDYEEEAELPVKVENPERYQNPDSGFKIIFEDEAALIPEEKQAELVEKMKPITKFGNVAFKSITENPTSAATFAERYYREKFNYDSGMVFLVDMDSRYLWIFSDGKIYKRMNEDYADTITDNVYRYASRKDYYECAWHVYDQAYKVMDGQKIAMPMKYICNLLLAINLALIINFFLVKILSHKHATSADDIMKAEKHDMVVSNIKAEYITQEKVYSPRSSGSSGSSHRSGGGGHSSGGSRSSGGGGGHRF